MNKCYVIMKRDFEYNDEIYTPTEGGIPKEYYTSLKAALKKCVERNMEAISDCNIMRYGYDASDVFTYEGVDFLKSKAPNYQPNFNNGDELIDILESCTYEEQEEFFTTGLEAPFYSVYEIEKGQ